MKVVVQGQGEVNLSQNDFVGSGGEGSIFVKGSTAFKVYSDPGKMIPTGKITELASITDPNVIKPERVLQDPKRHTPIGYTMRFVPGGMPLCQTFTRAFREREGLDHTKVLDLVKKLQEGVEHIHHAGVLLVDLNEMNFLINQAFTTLYFIDVDSYQTKSYPATALMPSVRDWQTSLGDFTEGSDWFSFACVAFQMFVGIHPYKGRHPTVQGLDERMQAGISVFDSRVSVPKVVYPFNVIPPAYLEWFKAILQDHKRVAPPSDAVGAAFVVLPRTVVGGAALDITELHSFSDQVLGYVENAGVILAWTAAGLFLDGRRVLGPTTVRAIGFSPKLNRAVIAWVEGGLLKLFDASHGKDMPSALQADEVMGSHGRIYVRSRDKVLELILTDTNTSVVASTHLVGTCLEHASRLYEGVLVQNLLGSTFVSVFPRSGVSYQIRTPELNTYRITDAKYENGVLMVLGTKKGQNDRLVFVFDPDHQTYAIRDVVRDITPAGLNFLVLESGVCVSLTEEEKIEVRAGISSNVRIVESPALGNDMRLVKHGGQVAFIRGNTISRMAMR